MAEDSRVVKTKRAITDGFIKLLGEKDIDSITVKDIADKAGVDRKTVYNYYPGVYALIDEIEDDFAKTMVEHASIFKKVDVLNNPLEFFQAVKEDVINNLQKYKDFLNAQEGSNILYKLTNIVEKNVEKNLIESMKKNGKEINPLKVKLCAIFLTDGMIGCCRNRMTRLEDNPDRFIKDVGTLALYGTAGIFVGIPKNK